MAISKSTMGKLVRTSEADEPIEVLFPDEAVEILEELKCLQVDLDDPKNKEEK